MRTLADIEIRAQHAEDYDALAVIHNAIYADWLVTGDEMYENAQEIDPARYVHVSLVAEDRGTGRVVAGGRFHHMPWAFQPDRYRIRLMVHPDWQRRGIGRRMMDELLAQLERRSAKWIQASVREDFARSVSFAQRYGFVEHARSFESRLDVRTVDLSRFEDYERRVADFGIVITTLAEELKRWPQCLPAVYEMHCTLDIGTPRDDPEVWPTPPTYEKFLEHSVHSPRALNDAYFLAKFGEMYAGETTLKGSDADPTFLHTELTGVLSEFRGLGIATALKVRAVAYAQQGDYRQIQTRNSSKNEAMLAINAKLGFVRKPAWIEFQRDLVKRSQ